MPIFPIGLTSDTASTELIAVIDGELTVKRIRMQKKKITLEPENENYSAQEINEDTEFEVWGVVTNVIHAL